VDLDSPDSSRFPLYGSVEAPIEFELAPGDALFIPPFWFHHVECLSPSVSVNVFAESSIKLGAMRLFMTGLPKGHDERNLRPLVRSFLIRIGFDPNDFISKLLESRYAPLGIDGEHLDDIQFRSESGSEVDAAEMEVTLESLCFCIEGIRRVVHVEEGRERDVEGLVQVLVSHLLELWTVQLVGPKRVHGALRGCL